jgi:hypothetical protein
LRSSRQAAPRVSQGCQVGAAEAGFRSRWRARPATRNRAAERPVAPRTLRDAGEIGRATLNAIAAEALRRDLPQLLRLSRPRPHRDSRGGLGCVACEPSGARDRVATNGMIRQASGTRRRRYVALQRPLLGMRSPSHPVRRSNPGQRRSPEVPAPAPVHLPEDPSRAGAHSCQARVEPMDVRTVTSPRIRLSILAHLHQVRTQHCGQTRRSGSCQASDVNSMTRCGRSRSAGRPKERVERAMHTLPRSLTCNFAVVADHISVLDLALAEMPEQVRPRVAGRTDSGDGRGLPAPRQLGWDCSTTAESAQHQDRPGPAGPAAPPAVDRALHSNGRPATECKARS